jgi:hypothetical protein
MSTAVRRTGYAPRATKYGRRIRPHQNNKGCPKKNGKSHTYWQWVESYRTPRGPRHRVVAYLGELDGSERRGWGRLALQLDGKTQNSTRNVV